MNATTDDRPQNNLKSDQDVDALLKRHLDAVANPEWWLTLLGTAMEDNDDVEAACAVADRAYQASPFPPPSEEDQVDRIVADDAALSAYATGGLALDADLGLDEEAPAANKALDRPRNMLGR